MGKGSGICHGTAGNGHAFLKVFERTGDELWLDRARRFAVHAVEQVERRAKGATRSSPATSGSRSTSPTASRAAARFRSSTRSEPGAAMSCSVASSPCRIRERESR